MAQTEEMWWLRWEYVVDQMGGWLTYGDVVTQIGEFSDSDRGEFGGSDRGNLVALIGVCDRTDRGIWSLRWKDLVAKMEKIWWLR